MQRGNLELLNDPMDRLKGGAQIRSRLREAIPEGRDCARSLTSEFQLARRTRS